MAWYVVSYDLRGKESEEAYNRIHQALQTAVDWCKPLLSHWIVETDLGPTGIINELLRLGAIDDDDGIVVLETTMRGQYRRIGPRAVEWLRQRITEC
jgi:hypothetical protein